MNKFNVKIESGENPHYLKKRELANKQFYWTKIQMEKIEEFKSKYPKDKSQSAILDVLRMAQNDFGGWLPANVQELVSETLNIPLIKVQEIVNFYAMFNEKPVGKYDIKVCTNCACLLNNSDKIFEAMKKEIGLIINNISQDGLFSIEEYGCLGACGKGPVFSINGDYYENQTIESALKVIRDIKGIELND